MDKTLRGLPLRNELLHPILICEFIGAKVNKLKVEVDNACEQAILLERTNKLQEDYESLFEEIKLLWEETTVIKLFLTNYFQNKFTRFQQTTKRSGKTGAKKKEV